MYAGPIYWKIHTHTNPPGGKYQPMSFRGINMKRRREKGENISEKGRKGKENEEVKG
jgi:hypothetical protein